MIIFIYINFRYTKNLKKNKTKKYKFYIYLRKLNIIYILDYDFENY